MNTLYFTWKDSSYFPKHQDQFTYPPMVNGNYFCSAFLLLFGIARYDFLIFVGAKRQFIVRVPWYWYGEYHLNYYKPAILPLYWNARSWFFPFLIWTLSFFHSFVKTIYAFCMANLCHLCFFANVFSQFVTWLFYLLMSLTMNK
jgi:hypothetical protein